ncbi:hypothetical protein F4553_000023 [Allocatelliglobosispora scoriae]|uniref:Uncharacterized protein n=1 Tax=Allocatelliglobosispora scoriae TaxID=643052 RepID=A0A841BEC7_9ACTN|nr:hypothetical protein [Allocatelliglobosispora scoriae]MBB5866644.1 hypothetical protein [Allocatelliglobosispora scoriae]
MRTGARYYTLTDAAVAERSDRQLPGPVQVGPREPLICPTGSLEDPAVAPTDPERADRILEKFDHEIRYYYGCAARGNVDLYVIW